MFVHRNQGLFLSVLVDDIKMAVKKKILTPMWKKMMKNEVFDEPTSFLDHVWDAPSVNANRMKQSLNNFRRCLSHVLLLEQQKNYRGGRKTHARTVAWSYDMEGHAPTCVARYCELAKKKWSNCTESQALAWMIINSSRKNSNQLENCQKFAHKLS